MVTRANATHAKKPLPAAQQKTKLPHGFSEANWKRLDKLNPDVPGRPVMDSQTAFLSAQAKKLGKPVADLTRQDLYKIANQLGSPGPSELVRIKTQMEADAAPRGWGPQGAPKGTVAGGFTEANWKKLDQLKPDSNKPIMPSQEDFLSREAEKLGKPVASLTRADLFAIANHVGHPGPSELGRIQASME